MGLQQIVKNGLNLICRGAERVSQERLVSRVVVAVHRRFNRQ